MYVTSSLRLLLNPPPPPRFSLLRRGITELRLFSASGRRRNANVVVGVKKRRSHQIVSFALFSEDHNFHYMLRVGVDLFWAPSTWETIATYDSLVRMAQDFSLRSPLIRGHGNFGSIDADPPAAMRYTECRLEALTEAMLLADLDLDTVDFLPNFDNSQKEPSLLPARPQTYCWTQLFILATALLYLYLCNVIAECFCHELEYMPGPDFPTGGIIMGNMGTKRNGIIIKEIPYQTNKASLVQKIAELVENKILEGISDIRDESDRSGMRLVIEVKRGSDPSIVLNNLYRHTALQSGFSCNMVGILNGQPKQMGLKELLQAFLDFRCKVVERRARYKLSQAEERNHIVEGIVVGLDNLDAVIDVVKKAPSNAAAAANLRIGKFASSIWFFTQCFFSQLCAPFSSSAKQVRACFVSLQELHSCIDFVCRSLGSILRNKLVDERKSLTHQISKLKELLSSKKQILQLIEEEAIEIKNKFSTPRRSMLEDADSGQVEDIDVIPNEEMLLAFSEKGYVKRMKPDTFNLQNRGTIGKSVGKLRVNDAMSDFLVCRAHDHVLYFSDKGIVYSARAYKIPECTRAAAGTPLIQILSLSDGERITSIIPVNEFAGDQYLLMLTVHGYIKKISLNYFSSIRSTGIIAIQLVPGDELKWVRCCSNDDYVAMASQNGQVILSSCEKLRSLSRNTRGAVAMRLKGEDKMASMDIIPAALWKEPASSSDHSYQSRKQHGPWLLFISESGYGKRVPVSSFRTSPLNRIGLIGYKFASEDQLVAVFVVGFSLGDDGESDEHVVPGQPEEQSTDQGSIYLDTINAMQ
ncbi:hypothetical protein Leryth_016624 [Lithospermum erythrorhizon]|nr:hypothetical protein Leryth_016624 [Lithospermum erythrorhizon]